MDSKPLWIIRQSLKKVWVRVVSIALLAILTVGLAPVLAPYLPTGLSTSLGTVAVDQILTILASSMLVVTTFSLSIAVSAFSAAANTATPRATALLQEDPTTQNVLATFLGAFLFSLIGLIALRSDIYDRAGRMLLFLATLAVVALVILALLRWISHLMTFGRMDDTLDRVEQAAAHSLEGRLAQPYLGGQPLYGAVPQDAVPVLALNTGYIQHIDINALAECAEAIDAELYIDALPGSFVHEAVNMLHIRGAKASEDQVSELRRAFTLGKERTFSQDPRFGVIVLSEIASRALSSAVNDPGTAISVIGRLVRILSSWTDYTDSAVDYPAVHVPPVLPADIMYDAFRPIARDGAALVEVQIRLHKALKALGQIAPRNFAPAAASLSDYALERARSAGLNPAELSTLEAAVVESKAIMPS
ncbi:DUF2254 domain-containing protein [Methylohalomonas lacus]|nr:DUF2254 domain-containing protein [Methylohalomonas lacus]